IRSFGAVPINYRHEAVADYVAKHTQGDGFDVVFDSVGGANMTNSFAAAALNGQVATTVSLVEIDLSEAHFKGLSLHVVFMLIPMLHNVGRAKHQTVLTNLAKIVDSGALRPLLDPTEFALEDAGAAYAHLQSGQAIGKVVISL
ncbi:MAG: zinc-binding dehydrogenase, partial [Pseudomonadota bacterium]